MLTESNLHLLAEEGLIWKEKVLEAIKGLLELAHEDDQTHHSGSAGKLLEVIAQTLAVKGSDEVSSHPMSRRRSAGSSKEFG
jgi:hypothetical protein